MATELISLHEIVEAFPWFHLSKRSFARGLFIQQQRRYPARTLTQWPARF